MILCIPTLKRLVIAFAAMVGTSCNLMIPVDSVETIRKAKPAAATAVTAAPLYEWSGAELPGSVAVKIDLSEQKARITRGGQPAGWTYVATGTRNHPTPSGSFFITEKVKDKRSTSWGQVVDSDGDVVIRDARNGRSSVPRGGRFVGAPLGRLDSEGWRLLRVQAARGRLRPDGASRSLDGRVGADARSLPRR